MRVLLDTVTFIWAVESPGRLSRNAFAALQDERAIRELSAISLSEIAIKQSEGKLALRAEDVLLATTDLKLRVLPYTADHAYHLLRLPLHHPDPFDRQIIAQALAENIPIVTSDESFRLYKGIEVVW